MKTWWAKRSARERQTLTIGLVLGGLILASAQLWSVLDETASIAQRLNEKHRWLAAYRAQPMPVISGLADQRLGAALRASGVAADRFDLAPRAEGGWRLTLRAAPFDALMGAIARGAAPGPIVRLELSAVGAGQVDGSVEFAPSS